MCVLCCIITVMKTLDSKKKDDRHQAQCSCTNWVEKLALPQCIFHRAGFKTNNQMEISTALWSKESAELPEKKKKDCMEQALKQSYAGVTVAALFLGCSTHLSVTEGDFSFK